LDYQPNGIAVQQPQPQSGGGLSATAGYEDCFTGQSLPIGLH